MVALHVPSFSHNSPVNPSVHLQLGPLGVLAQVAPLRHGLSSHGSRVISKWLILIYIWGLYVIMYIIR